MFKDIWSVIFVLFYNIECSQWILYFRVIQNVDELSEKYNSEVWTQENNADEVLDTVDGLKIKLLELAFIYSFICVYLCNFVWMLHLYVILNLGEWMGERVSEWVLCVFE